MPLPVDYLLVATLVVLFPLRAAVSGIRRLRHASPERLPAERRAVYLEAMAIQWTLTAAVLGLWVWQHRPWRGLGMIPFLTPGLLGVGIGLAIISVLLWRQRAGILRNGEALAELRERMSHIEVMLPHTGDEMRRFVWLSFTAGICEEILYRGYLLWFLVHWLGLLPAAGVTAVIFGVGHAYQGAKGMLQTGLFGAFLAAVYLVTGSLLMPIVLHVLMDLHSGHLLYVAYRRAAEDRAQAMALARATAEEMVPHEP